MEDQRYHLNCFRCEQCKVVLDGNYYVSPTGKFVCPSDYMVGGGGGDGVQLTAVVLQETLPKCHHCQLPIKEKILRALEAQYHPDCFRCNLCDKGLDGVPFILTDNSTNCVDCYKT